VKLRRHRQPEWWQLDSWQQSLAHLEAVYAARYASLSARLVVLEDLAGRPAAPPEMERV
jgi:hypothetical protein